jgi:RNA polymerase sigma-70 factor (ECF subfamily)
MNKNFEKYTDTEILQLSKKEPDSFGILIDRYEKKLRKYIYRITHANESDINDMLQNIFLKVYEYQNSFNGKYSFNSWIYRITHNEAIDFLRKKTIRQTISFEEYMDQNKETFDISNIFEENEEIAHTIDKKTLLLSIDKLNIEQKIVLNLKYFEDKSYEEIAIILEKPKSTIGTLIRRAKINLEKIIKQKDYE